MASFRPRSLLVEGVLLLDKAAGLTSHDAIAGARRALGTRRVGHLGTLDPFATGLLVLLVGRFTRLGAYMQGEPKVYDATIVFGNETDTDDLTGRPTRTAALPRQDDLAAAIATLSGAIDQEPPSYSAKQVEGVRAYAAARAGAPLQLRSVRVDVHGWTVRGWRDAATLDVTITCGGGTYIRALARDLGRRLESAAHLSALRRTRSGPYRVEDATRLERLPANPPLRSPLEALAHLDAVIVTSEERTRITRGQPIAAAGAQREAGGASQAVLVDGDEIVGVAERRDAVWAPKVVLANG